MSQFEPPGLVDAKLMEEPPATRRRRSRARSRRPRLTYAEDGGANRVDRVSFSIPAGEHVALVGRRAQRQGRHHAPARAPGLPERRAHRRGGHELRRRASGGAGTAHRLRDAERVHLLGTAVAQPLLRPHAPAAAAGDLRRGAGEARADPRARRADRRQQPRRRPRGLDRLRGRRRGRRRGADRSRARRAAARGDGAGGHRLRPRERLGSAGPAVDRGDGAGGAGAHPGPRAARGPRVVRRAVRSAALSLEHQRRREPAVRHAAQPGVPAGQPARQSRVRRAAARRRAAGRSLRGGREGGGPHGRAVRRRRARQRPVRPVQLHQRGRPAGVPGAAGEDRRRHAGGDDGRGEGAACWRSPSGSSRRSIGSA